MRRDASASLPAIPVIELGRGGPVALLEATRGRAEALLGTAQKRYPPFAIRFGDRLSRRWLGKAGNPYLGEITEIAHHLGAPGAFFLNVSYEWGCTTAVVPNPSGGNRLLRILDWPFDGLGAQVVAARFEAEAGPWINLTWPGFVGVVQAMAPGRFAACFNQAPLRHRTGAFAADWTLERVAVWRKRALPPAHLLRLAFETCPDYAAAKRLLTETPLALPAIFLLSGTQPDEGCVIERLERRAFVLESPHAAANHWQTPGLRGRNRGTESEHRCRLMSGRMATAADDLAWLTAPILNPTTRLALVAEAGSGSLTAVGIENEAPATATLRLEGTKTDLRAAV